MPGTAGALTVLGALDCDEGNYVSALRHLKESLRLSAEVGDRVVSVGVLELIGYASMSEEPKRAARLWGAAERLREDIGAPMRPEEDARYRRMRATARTAAGDDEAFDAAWRSGRALGFEAAVEYALARVLGPRSTR